jgi:hypothetical protein
MKVVVRGIVRSQVRALFEEAFGTGLNFVGEVVATQLQSVVGDVIKRGLRNAGGELRNVVAERLKGWLRRLVGDLEGSEVRTIDGFIWTRFCVVREVRRWSRRVDAEGTRSWLRRSGEVWS